MSEAEADRQQTYTSAQRCPFCRERIVLEEEAWVACVQCLGRHHRACWDESGSCAACSCQRALASEEALEPELDLRPLPESGESGAQRVLGHLAPSPEEYQRETARLFAEAESRGGAWSGALMTLLTLGVWPVVQGERRLLDHQHANQRVLEAEPGSSLPPDLQAQLDEARQKAGPYRGGFGLLARRYLLPFVSVLAWVLAIGFACYRASGGPDPRAQQLVALLSALGSLGTLGYLHAFREAVRGHERNQLFVRLVNRAVPPAASRNLLERLDGRWRDSLLLHGGLTLGPLAVGLLTLLGAAAPGGPWVLLALVPLLCALAVSWQVRKTLRTHTQNEEEADELTRLYKGEREPPKPPPAS